MIEMTLALNMYEDNVKSQSAKHRSKKISKFFFKFDVF